MPQLPQQKRPPINFKSMIVRYIINVVSFAAIYASVSYILILMNVAPFTATIIGVAVAVIIMFSLMRRIGPKLDKYFDKTGDKTEDGNKDGK